MGLFDVGMPAIVTKETDVFPTSSWTEQRALYLGYENYWNGNVFNTKAENIQVESGKKPLRWPVKYNLVKMMITMHSMALFGDWDEAITRWRAEPRPVSEILYPGRIKKDEQAKRQAQGAEELIFEVWKENRRDTLLIEQELARNTYGGCVFRVRKDLKKRHRVKLETINPYYFKPIWHPGDYHELVAAKVEFPMENTQAAAVYGSQYATEEFPIYSEEWDPQKFTITVGGKQYDGGPNELGGRVPFVYIPRMRMGQFYGISLCEDLMGIQDELNDRIADIGDQILAECHSMLVLANFPGDARKLRPSPTGILNLGMGAPGRGDPGLDRVPAGDIPRGAMEYIRFLVDISRNAAFVPSVAFGEDEGSQRSGVTLVIRMWPLMQQAKWSRAWWDDGFRDIEWLILKHMELYGAEGYRKELSNQNFVTEWASIQPKDREALVLEAVSLAGANLQSREELIKRLGNAKDEESELAQIKAWFNFEKGMQRRGQAQVVEGSQAQR